MRRVRVIAVAVSVVALCAGTIAGAQGSGSASNDQYTNDGGATSLAEERVLIANQELLGPDLSPGLYYPEGSGAAVYRVFADQELDGAAKHVATAGREGTVEVSSYRAAELDEISALLEEIEIPEGTAFGGAYDAEADLYVLAGNVPESSVAEKLRGRRYVYTFNESDNVGRLSRSSDASPHSGGAKIWNTSQNDSQCSSGFSVRSGSTHRMLTAAHCGNLNNNFKSPGGQTFGQLKLRAPFPKFDLAAISGSSKQHQGKIYIGGASGTLKPVKSAGGPGTGGYYCTSGSVSYQQCGFSVSSLNGEFCDASGCTKPLVRANMGTVLTVGDSGGPFYTYTGTAANPTGILARGIIVAHDGSYSYFENWQRAAAELGVTIATS